MRTIINGDAYRFISSCDKDFIIAFDGEMNRLGYTCGQTIGEGYCWGRKMIIYTKAGVKSKKSYARVYIRDDGLILRMYFSNVDKHAQAIGQAPDYIRNAFVGDYGTCKHCHNEKSGGACAHRKTYSVNDKKYELCDGFAFWFYQPDARRLPEYIKLFLQFYPDKKSGPCVPYSG